MKTLFLSIATAALAAVVVAAAPGSPGRPAAAPDAAQGRPALTIRSSDYGRIVFDMRGRALYAFTRDRGGRSTCSGACARAWPPYLVRGRPRAGAGIAASLLGTTRRGDGTLQLTFAGRPLYYYVGDRAPGQVLCQNVFEFGGLWLVVRPNGRLVR